MLKPLCKCVLIAFLLLWIFSVNGGAENQEEIAIHNDTSLVNVEKNDFEQLLSADTVVYQLRKKYGIRGSVMLTHAVWQILTSFSNQQQAHNIWEIAIASVANIDDMPYGPQLNFEFTSAQILSQYTHGMDLHKWYDKRTVASLSKKNIEASFALNDDLSLYLQLEGLWEIILPDIIKQDNIMWNEVFMQHINLFSQSQQKPQTTTKDSDTDNDDIFAQLLQWQNSGEDSQYQLADVLQSLHKSDASYHPLFYSIIRFSLNKQQNYYLASALSWLEVAYRLKAAKAEFSAPLQQQLYQYIEQIDTWFLAHEQQLMAVNRYMPQWIEASIHALKNDNNTVDSLVYATDLIHAYQALEVDFNKYMQTPFRSEIKKNLEVCLNISEEIGPYPQVPISENQFIGCVRDFVRVASEEAKSQGLAGQLSKVSSLEAMVRTLKLPAWQNINILYANQSSSSCIDKSSPLVNPLEWSLAAESLLWFTDRWPSYVQIYPQTAEIVKIIAQGDRLIGGFDCLEKPQREILDEQFGQIMQAWQNVKSQISQVVNEFNQMNLAAGSDINLLTGSNKPSSYRVEEAKISACDVQQSCGLQVNLDSSRALFGLFPSHLLMADQLKLGQLKLCYDNVGWENRRSAPTHLDNDSIANYFGQFSFSLKGFYDEVLIFERKITSKTEYHYLFAEKSEEVLASYCPLSVVGNRISTTLKQGTYGLVPNRLTFLTVSRANESKILSGNWSAGEEWKDLISSEQATVISKNSHDELIVSSQQAYQQKAKQLQDLIYSTLLNRNPNSSAVQTALTQSFQNLQRMTRLQAQLLFVFYPNDMFTSDSLHAILYGMDKIPDAKQLDEYYQNQLNINQLIQSLDENMQNNQIKWNEFTPYGSYAYLKNILFRLKTKI